MKVSVDSSLCEASLNCLASAPDIFDLDADSGPAVVLVDVIPDDQRDAVALAVRNCPQGAIALQDD
ncbi:MAG TPA: ferredoxin [Solirubrobacterales bacterium]|nr:ferredoxin [Solirubrobacterales bacterium]